MMRFVATLATLGLAAALPAAPTLSHHTDTPGGSVVSLRVPIDQLVRERLSPAAPRAAALSPQHVSLVSVRV